MSLNLKKSLDELIKDSRQQRQQNNPMNQQKQNREQKFNQISRTKIIKKNSFQQKKIEFQQTKQNFIDQDNQKKPRKIFIRSSNGFKEVIQNSKIIVKNLSDNIDNKSLRVNLKFIKEIFQKCGKLKKLGIIWDDLGYSTGQAIIEFQNYEGAQKAIQECHDCELDTQIISVTYDQN